MGGRKTIIHRNCIKGVSKLAEQEIIITIDENNVWDIVVKDVDAVVRATRKALGRDWNDD